MTRPPAGTVHLSIRVTPELWARMQQVMRDGQHPSNNEFVRTCIRAYLDESGEVLGSRRHFTNRMNQRLNRLEALVIWNALQVQMLVARGHFTILDELAPEDAAAEPPLPAEQFRQAHDASKRVLAQFLEEQSAIIGQLAQYVGKQQAAANAKGAR